jgi:hypothetical protein
MAQPAPLPVLNLALMPTVGFAAITQQVVCFTRGGSLSNRIADPRLASQADNIGKKMREVNDKGLTVWLVRSFFDPCCFTAQI